ncbi:triacylglycerol lipase [Streptomyces sp. 840.1]|uniref:esterase/lipase family protein n=1 Tax=Streptomyces sp. 840.1 TaxID=2485152 RepID=UPI0011CEAD3B|nr:alpha/beta hydrolase [Streptomyces sp. 840.1]
MSEGQLGVVLIHGIRSDARVWQPLEKCIAEDTQLDFVRTLPFEYATGLKRLHPLRVFPSIDTAADSLKEYLVTEAGGFDRLMLITHSQGGLVAQRYLARMLADGAAHELVRIRRMVLLACPNNGSELLRSLRQSVLGSRHPQEKDLRPISDQVTGTLRTVLRDVVNATGLSERTCPIDIKVYAGESDGVVPAASAQSVFPHSAVLPGDHSGILKVKTARHRTFTTLRRLMLTVPEAVPDAVSEAAPEAAPAGEARPDRPPAPRETGPGSVSNNVSGSTVYGHVIQGGSVRMPGRGDDRHD